MMSRLNQNEHPVVDSSRSCLAATAVLCLVVLSILLYFLLRHTIPLEPSIGTLVRISGTVELRGGYHSWEPAAVDAKIPIGSEIHTATDSTALIEWPEGSRLAMGRNTTAIIHQSQVDRSAAVVSRLCELERGVIWVHTRSTRADLRFRLQAGKMHLVSTGGTFKVSRVLGTAPVAYVLAGEIQAGSSQHLFPIRPGMVVSISPPGEGTNIRPASPEEKASWRQPLELLE